MPQLLPCNEARDRVSALQMSTIRMGEAAAKKIRVLSRNRAVANRHRSRGNTCPVDLDLGPTFPQSPPCHGLLAHGTRKHMSFPVGTLKIQIGRCTQKKQHQRTVWNVWAARRWTVCGRSRHGARAHVHTVRAMPLTLLQHGPGSRASGQPTGVAGRCLEAHRRCVQESQHRESACGCWQRGHGNAHHCERPDTRSSRPARVVGLGRRRQARQRRGPGPRHSRVLAGTTRARRGKCGRLNR